MRYGWIITVLVTACADAGSSGPADAPTERDGSVGTDSGSTAQACPADQLATNADASGQLTCTPIDAVTRAAIGTQCSAYLGWRDECGGCTTAPSKWGRVSASSCSPGTGIGNTCTTPTLGGTTLHMFGLDLDNGDMDGNDKLHAGLHCSGADSAASIAPCAEGSFVTGRAGSSWTCGSFANTVVDFVQNNCSIYLGWQDGCNGCTTPPTKWGRVSGASCEVGAGADNTCNAPATLGSEDVRLFGLNTDGDVDGNDKFHVALHCETPAPAMTTTNATCPAGQFMVATVEGGIRCESPAPQIARYVIDRCSLYFGWRDGCNGCTDPPSKWGKVSVGACANGAGADNTCTQFTLGTTVEMFGLNTDGDVDGNDTFFVGFHCD